MIPQVVDTVLFVEDGAIKKFYETRFTVKVPAGMVEADLARPVIEVVDVETAQPEFEIYTYGEEVVVMPLEGMSASKPIWDLAEREIAREIGRLISGPIDVVVDAEGHAIVSMTDREIPKILGREGRRIAEIEKALGISIDVRSLKETGKTDKTGKSRPRPAEVDMNRRSVTVRAGQGLSGQNVEVAVAGKPTFIGTVGRDGIIRVAKGSESGKALEDAFFSGQKVTIRPLE